MRIQFLLLFLLLLLTSCLDADKGQKLTIASAANMQFATRELAGAFSEASGIETELILGASGNLTAQIASGAPYDVFLSADMQYPRYLFERGFGYQEPEVYGYGQLVLWSCTDDLVPSLDVLNKDNIRHIAIPNPELAPYGKAAKEVLDSHEMYEQIAPKLVFGESVAQTNQFIRTGAAEIGFTALSVVVSPQLKEVGKWTPLPREQYTPIAQGILIVGNQAKPPENALKFYTFLKSTTGREILSRYGYLSAYE